MEKQSNKKWHPGELVFVFLMVAAAIFGLLWYHFGNSTPGTMVEITQGSKVIGSFPLGVDREIPIEVEGVQTNLLRIADEKVEMEWADCPDQICVKHRMISCVGETIVCLPNKVVVSIIGSEEPAFIDSIAR